MLGWRAKFGVILCAQNTVVEPEFYAMAPKSIAIYAARTTYPSETLREESHEKCALGLEAAADQLVLAKVDLIGHAAGSLSFFGGWKPKRRKRESWRRGQAFRF